MAVSLATSSASESGTQSGSAGSGWCRCAAMTSAEVPRKGVLPDRHSYSTTPREYRSLAAVPQPPEMRSGAMYKAVPMTMPGAVIGAEPAACAIPKSVSFTRPSELSSMLPGLMSRCTRRARCAAASPSAACARMSQATSASSGPRSISSASDGPSTYSSTRYGCRNGPLSR